MKNRFLKLLSSIIVVFVFNFFVVFCVALLTEKQNEKSIEKGSFEDIMLTESTTIDFSYYNLLNWETGESFNNSKNVTEILKYSKYEKVSYFEQVVIQTLQNRFNSVVMLFLDPQSPDIDKNSEDFKKQNDGRAGNVCCLKIFDQYYIIIDYYFLDNGYTGFLSSGLPLTSVYKAIDSQAISQIDEYKSVGRSYGSYSFYPLSLAHYVSTPLLRIFNLLYLFIQVFIVHKFIKSFVDDKRRCVAQIPFKIFGSLIVICVIYFVLASILNGSFLLY
ncbi:MAG: hypothetical protein E7556_07945 [Ruminococcaceae bacterium]|nr:hypothetical protein [Oscillospiraceae bacterium]